MQLNHTGNTPEKVPPKPVVYKTRFLKKDLALALDRKYDTHLVSPSGETYSHHLKNYFTSFKGLMEELEWTEEDYKKWIGYLDPHKSVIICKHLDLTVEDFRD